MATTEFLAYWGAGLSTGLAIREVWKHRRATRPKLVGYMVRNGEDGRFVTAMAPGQTEATHGRVAAVSVLNRGGTATKIHKARLCIARPWCPRILLGILGEFGFAPTRGDDELAHIPYSDDGLAEIKPGQEEILRVTLWEQHRAALRRGRLMLNVVDTWNREKPQQIRIRRTA